MESSNARKRPEGVEAQLRIAELERALRRSLGDASAAKEEVYALRRKVVKLEAELHALRSSATRERVSRETPIPVSTVRPPRAASG